MVVCCVDCDQRLDSGDSGKAKQPVSGKYDREDSGRVV